MISITVNGELVSLEKPVTVAAYLDDKGFQVFRIAVERNGAIVPKSLYAQTFLEEGDQLEIVTFMGGG